MQQVQLRRPRKSDGLRVHDLVERCPPLDRNSIYCNLLQVTHFADTCILAEDDSGLLGFVTGYLIPDRRHVLFVWQVGVRVEARGRNLGQRLLLSLLARCNVSALETTVTPANASSRRMFERLAESLLAPVECETLFSRDTHFGQRHADEILLRIGPIDREIVNRLRAQVPIDE